MTRNETPTETRSESDVSRSAIPRLDATTVSPKILPSHLDRLAVVYVRQSSPQQIVQNRESRERQYALADHAVALGWPRERVLVIDDDTGTTGKTAEHRDGFHRVLAEVTMDHVGLVLGIEMSRLARSNKDWHHLLELCAVFGTILADEDGIYDPNDSNDRLLLGLKGTISEFELVTMRNRLNRGRLNKARRGELFTLAPIGYVRRSTDELAFDSDEQVQTVVHLIFEKFEEFASASAVVRYFQQHGVQIGVRLVNGRSPSPIEWRPLGPSTLLEILHNPTYAGAYSQGRRKARRRSPPGSSRPGRRFLPMEEWDVLLPDAVPAYITWDQFVANQKTLKRNHARMSTLGSARNGVALLPGLLICGFCGARMVVQYQKGDLIRYCCLRQCVQRAAKQCQLVNGNPLEDLVREKLFQVLEPAALELCLQAAEEIQGDRDRLHRNWQLRLERARYEADRAHRQYDAAEPENRLVVRDLEQRWETALRTQRTLEEDYDRFCLDQPLALSAQEKERIRALSSVVPSIWNAPETTPQDRKLIVRQLIERVVVRRNGEIADVTIHWAGGYVSAHQIAQPVGSYRRLRDFERLKQRVLELHWAGRTYSEICARLIEEHFPSPKGTNLFRPENIRMFLERYCSQELGPDWGSFREYLRSNEWLVGDLSRELGIPQATLQYWRRRGWLHGRQLRPGGGRWIFWADYDELNRLRKLRACPINHNAKEQPYPEELMTPRPGPKP